jgi:uncharacterized membrane protein
MTIYAESPTDNMSAQIPPQNFGAIPLGQPNVALTERIASGIAGAALASFAIARKPDVGGAALALAGGYLLFRGVTGQCIGYAALGAGTTPGETSANAVIGHGQGIRVEKTITIDRPTADLFDFWRNFSNLARFMSHLESVTVQDETHSHWIANAPFGKTVEWDAEIINEDPGRMIAWRSIGDADVPNAGSVWFAPAPAGRGTVVKVTLAYDPPAGRLGSLVAKITGEEPGQQVSDDLRHLKNLMETGEIPTIVGQPQGNRAGHSAA